MTESRGWRQYLAAGSSARVRVVGSTKWRREVTLWEGVGGLNWVSERMWRRYVVGGVSSARSAPRDEDEALKPPADAAALGGEEDQVVLWVMCHVSIDQSIDVCAKIL